MTNPIRKFSRNGLLAALKDFWRQEAGESAAEPLRDFSPDHMPYIEVMLPVTGVVAPLTFERKHPRRIAAPVRLG